MLYVVRASIISFMLNMLSHVRVSLSLKKTGAA
jgi:hypothetical protein